MTLFIHQNFAQKYHVYTVDTIKIFSGIDNGDTLRYNLVNTGDTINRIDKKGLKVGNWMFYENSKLKTYGTFRNGKKDGYFHQFYSNGNVLSTVMYNNDSPVGFSLTFHPNGKLKESCFYTNNQFYANYELYYPSGNIKQKTFYGNNGKYEGYSKSYYENGIIDTIRFFLQGEEQVVMAFDTIREPTYLNAHYKYGTSSNAINQMTIIAKSENENVFQKDIIAKKQIEVRNKNEKIRIAKIEQENEKKIRNLFIFGFVLMIILTAIISKNFIRKKKDNQIITTQKELVEEKHREITDSINYAERIQRSFLATKE